MVMVGGCFTAEMMILFFSYLLNLFLSPMNESVVSNEERWYGGIR